MCDTFWQKCRINSRLGWVGDLGIFKKHFDVTCRCGPVTPKSTRPDRNLLAQISLCNEIIERMEIIKMHYLILITVISVLNLCSIIFPKQISNCQLENYFFHFSAKMKLTNRDGRQKLFIGALTSVSQCTEH